MIGKTSGDARSAGFGTSVFAPSSAGAPAVTPVQPAEPSAFLWNVPMLVLCLLAFNHFGRPFEFFLTGYKIPFVISAIGILVAITSRGLKALNTAPGRPLFALVGWMLACTAFSYWRGGSIQYMLYFVGLEVVLFMLAATAPRSFADIRKVCYVILFAYLVYALIGATGGATGPGVAPSADVRLDLKGTFGNADDVALLAGFVLPFLVLAAIQIRSLPARMVLLVGGGGLLLRAVGMTGTRAAIPALLGMLAVYFIRGSAGQRVALVVMSVLGGLLMIVILPDTILTRFATLTKAFDVDPVVESGSDEAMASVVERRDLLRDAVRITINHPIFGVGPGEYPDYRANFMDTQSGRHKRFFPSHNTYLEVSSEEGIPGLLCYLAFLGAVFWTIRRSFKLNQPGSHADWRAGYQVATALEAAFIYFVIGAGFMTCERHPHQYAVAGLAVALYRISKFRTSAFQNSQSSSVVAMARPAAAVSPMPVGAGSRVLSESPAARAGTVPGTAVLRPRSALRRPR